MFKFVWLVLVSAAMLAPQAQAGHDATRMLRPASSSTRAIGCQEGCVSGRPRRACITAPRPCMPTARPRCDPAR